MAATRLTYNSPPSGWLDDYRVIQKRRVIMRSNHVAIKNDLEPGQKLQRGYVRSDGKREWKDYDR